MNQRGKNTLILLSFAVLFLAPSLAMSDCADFTRMNGWGIIRSNSLFFLLKILMATINLKNCTADSSSHIRGMKRYLCDNDSMMVNGQECAIMTLTSASSGSF